MNASRGGWGGRIFNRGMFIVTGGALGVCEAHGGRGRCVQGGLDTCMSFKSGHCVSTASSLARESEVQVEGAKI